MRSVIAARAKLAPGAANGELLSLRRRYPNLIVQLVSLERVPGNRAIAMIGQQTLRAAKTGAMLAAKPEVDLLLRLAGTAQIVRAIENAGYGARGTKLLVAAGPELDAGRLRRELAKSPDYVIMRGEDIDAEDLATVERAALLGTRS